MDILTFGPASTGQRARLPSKNSRNFDQRHDGKPAFWATTATLARVGSCRRHRAMWTSSASIYQCILFCSVLFQTHSYTNHWQVRFVIHATFSIASSVGYTMTTTQITTSPTDMFFKLNTGTTIPAIGLGTWLSDPDQVKNAVKEALKIGYRHIDTAAIYGNEDAVGEAIQQSGIPRSDIFLTSKLWCNSHRPEDVLPALNKSLEKLKTDYLDMYHMHWPVALKPGAELFPRDENGHGVGDPLGTDYVVTWKAMEKIFRETNKVRNIGVSNFTVHQLDRLLRNSEIVPAAIQIELHPYSLQGEIREFAKDHGIHVTAYSPFGNLNPTYADKLKEKGVRRKVIDDPVVTLVAEKYHATPNQILVSFQVALGDSVIPKSVHAERIKENFTIIRLDIEDVFSLSKLNKNVQFNTVADTFGPDFARIE
ncbi:NADP-dependent oxidoreductase domain-containing protein [Lipomyces tetrasporus]